MIYIIGRTDKEKILNEKQWVLVYGRRKTGKTFLLRNLCRFDNYFTVKKDLNVISNDQNKSLKESIEEIKKLLANNETVVIDEFQRLNESTLEELTLKHPKGKLILSGSSLRVIKKIFEPKSPLLGFFIPIKISFISASDMLLSLHGKLEGKQLIEISAFIREPWLIPSYNNEKIIDFVYKLIVQSKHIVAALVGEIFTEEEREISKKYEALLRLIGSGVWKTKDLTSTLYSRKIIPEPSQAHIIQYLKNLEDMELIEKIKLYKTKGNYYRIKSPLMNVYYYLEDRYNLNEREITLDEVRPTLQKLISFEIQNFIADLYAEVHKGRKEYFVSPNKEVDFVITVRNKPSTIGEVKWKEIDSEDLEKLRKNSEKIHGNKILVCKSSSLKHKPSDIQIFLPKDLISLVKSYRRH